MSREGERQRRDSDEASKRGELDFDNSVLEGSFHGSSAVIYTEDRDFCESSC